MILNLIEMEKLKLPNQDPSRIFVGGFAEGAVTALAAYLRYDDTSPLGGVFALSGF